MKTALITGAASGIGRYIAMALSKQGYSLLLVDLNLAQAQTVAESIVSEGGNAQAFALNIANKQDIADFIRQHDNIDVLINNAGVQHVEALEHFPEDKWQLLQDVMLTGPAMLCKAVLPHMRKGGFGRIVNIGSIHALVASKYKSAYVAAKHGLIGFGKVLALETADCDITVNTICPAYVKTPLVEQQITAQANQHGISEDEVINNIMLAPMPKKAFIGLDEIAHAVNFLLANESRNITGQAIVLDGGWTVQ
ncbi:3-hydroxybutyrate dehydrogenase [Pseudoalteromonas peptidolytica]|uniref:3-hydroxybutyrate dehydrogenase n=1 Tax=Pseudoalteromonas peptidolytica F12-50-A1 TaxID=1315280 RepID=A0A8I0MZF4_9GAMM|nr:3-hydroxybutyrate dehydrogenase [Pseudoalteromonas peptidolytica]MBE0348133.1 3-hydroxybutyrate dehydrogenase [Pseudoalteromonas peptidolytica F12-50-A1]NLR15526.1 3-hydroxybutyrate dehydrogenase [Pseudoalteromonas peptidolytica]GEK08504.1 3-hydroxybutyrate dehydrogenase [Pseudoalteromonas peptidolytica]